MIPFAATTLALRDTPEGLEVLMVKRTSRARFMPSAWVFPGGKLEDADRNVVDKSVHARDVAIFEGVDAGTARALAIAAIRETWEEANVWLGTTSPPVFDVSALHPWSRWVTPEGESRRYDTVFFLTAAPPLLAPKPDDQEVVKVGWFQPLAMLRASRLERSLAPPTWWALQEIARFSSVRDAVDACAVRDMRPICPIRVPDPSVLAIALPGDVHHPESGRDALPSRIAWTEGGWLAEH